MQVITEFPSRFYHVVWRNWDILPAGRLARGLACPESALRRLAADLGLGAQPVKLAEHRLRYRSLAIRRNWHLLPAAQIAALVGLRPAKLATFMREDDFLDAKLPPKPHCAPLRYRPPSPTERQAARRMADALSALPESARVESAFAFLSPLRRGRADVVPARMTAPVDCKKTLQFSTDVPAGMSAPKCWALSPRILHPYDTPHNATAFDPENTPVPYLRLLREFGADALWFPVVVFNLIRLPGYPEFGGDRREYLPKFRSLIERSRQAGLKFYLYICEPRGQPEAFFRRHPKLRGARARMDMGVYHLCTSTPEGQRLVRDSMAALCRSLPGLAGIIDISASEYPSHCWSHANGERCPRCRSRRPADVVAELFRLMQEGIADSGQKVDLIAWNWGWQWALTQWKKERGKPACDVAVVDLKMEVARDSRRYIFERLPKEVTPLLTFEYGTRVRRGRGQAFVWEYAISQSRQGPFAAVQKCALDSLGRDALARIHISSSTEYLGAPYIPALHLVAEKISDVRRQGYTGFMGAWTFGGYPSPNLLVARELCRPGKPDPAAALRRVAGLYYGEANAATVVRAWKLFSDAFRHYPFSIPFQYTSPLHIAPAVAWPLTSTGEVPRMYGPSDDPETYCQPYGPETIRTTLEIMADLWEQGLAVLRGALRGTDAAHRLAAERDCGVAEAFGLCCRSTANHIRFCALRIEWGANAAAKRQLRALVIDELGLATRYYQLMRADSRIAFEASMQYFVLPSDVREKILGLHQILAQLD